MKVGILILGIFAFNCSANSQDKLELLNGDWKCSVDDVKTEFGKVSGSGTHTLNSTNMSYTTR